ncbi:hypothetical protein [Paenibacillus donghaensis]|uniref:Phage ABA sandwich domain-containing protein n=1 Tax=Paenibacillus donghaensis TaxID=414771 RepID=A0A2Z2KTB0_9BACL|nr:hypothetical protein [Paenibacillus donghaensis]ASA22608.1 hypothetical protein B9T62_18550 [Paenibacillus donghaensis]
MEPGKELDGKFANLINYISLTTCLNIDGSFGHIPQYSSTWEGMRLVVDEMISRDWWPRIEMSGRVWYLANFWNCKNNKESKVEVQETMPFAIIMAAIDILEKEKTLNK